MINFIEITNELFKNSFVNKLTVEVVSLRLLLAVVFGGIVGYTREKDNKPAGFRTHILVCFGAAVISMVQDQLRLNILELASINLKLSGVIKTENMDEKIDISDIIVSLSAIKTVEIVKENYN